jgi:hypothetical protein
MRTPLDSKARIRCHAFDATVRYSQYNLPSAGSVFLCSGIIELLRADFGRDEFARLDGLDDLNS